MVTSQRDQFSINIVSVVGYEMETFSSCNK